MGIKNALVKVGKKAADRVAKLSVLSPEQLATMEKNRENYLTQMPSENDQAAEEMTRRFLATCGVEIYNAYLPRLSDLYVPVQLDSEYEGRRFDSAHNVRYINITKWVMNKEENNIEKLINVYEVLSNEDCNIALVFHRSCEKTDVFLAVTNNKNDDNNVDIENYKGRITDSIRGNFPGAEWKDAQKGDMKFLDMGGSYSVAAATNIPTEKSEKFISQTIEKLLDGIVPASKNKEYTIILLATPIHDVEERKLRLSEIYSGLAPYAAWVTNYTFTESDSVNSMATFGVNAGVSAGIQQGQNSALTTSNGVTDSTGSSTADTTGSSTTESTGRTETDSTNSTISDTVGENSSETIGSSTTQSEGTVDTVSHTDTTGHSESNSESTGHNNTAGAHAGFEVFGGVNYNHTWTENSTTTTGESSSVADTLAKAKSITQAATDSMSKTTGESTAHTVAESIGRAVATTTGRAVAESVGRTVASTLGKAVTSTIAKTAGIYQGLSFGGNFGTNFARSSNVTATVGKNEGIQQSFTNHTIKHTLEILDGQMKRLEEGAALGMWDFAAYVLSEDLNVANNVAHSYLALTQGEESYTSKATVNLWRGDMGEASKDAEEIVGYLRTFRHPLFGLNPSIVDIDKTLNVYPALVTATTTLSGKELAYSLNFPRKSIAGLPVIECAEFGRNIVKYNNISSNSLKIGKIFHMNTTEKTDVDLTIQSLASHTFITGSTGSGKSNTVYTLLDRANEAGVKFLVIEPAKGEYKRVFGNRKDVKVYSTNPGVSELIKINPFSFPKGVHVFEHLDRLVEIFNVCWPMYAAMPAILKRAIEQSYIDCGWNLKNSENAYGEGLFPSFSDITRNIRSIIDSSEYDNDNKGAYKGSLITRLQSMTNGINGLIFSNSETPISEILKSNVVVDLSRVGSNETKSLIMGMMVLKIQEERLVSRTDNNSKLSHITVLEEAHNILKRSSIGSPADGGNLVGKSVEMISNAIAEMRTYGEGFVIVDQAPGLLDMSVIRNTNTKIILRLPDEEDRYLVGKAANLNNDQINELSKLPCGVAAIYQNEWIQPILCSVDLYEYEEQEYHFEYTEEASYLLNLQDRIEIASLLSKGIELSDKNKLQQIYDKLFRSGFSSSLIVLIMRMLEKPYKEPRMTKLAPVMNAFFPSVTEAVKLAFFETQDEKAWTDAAEKEITDIGITNDRQLVRDIIQGVITNYLLIEMDNKKALFDWSQKGALR